MILKVRRETFSPKSTIGDMAVDGQHFCYTLERPRADLGTPETLKGPDGLAHPCIPAGIYKTERFNSPHFSTMVLRLIDVPGRTNILIHPANWAYQLEGCIAVGAQKGLDYIGSSRAAFDALMEKTAGQDVEVDIC